MASLVSIDTIKNQPIIQEYNILTSLDKILQSGLFNRLLTVQWLAHELHISERQLLRIIKKKHKVSTNTYINNYKLDIARQVMILNERVTVKTLATKLLFSDSKYFSKLFRKKFGVTPSELKKVVHNSEPKEVSINLGIQSQAS